jgi:hypothetical protein
MLTPQKEDKMVRIENLRTIKAYADLKGVTRQAVWQAIKNGWHMEDVQDVHKVNDKVLIEVKGREV